MKDKRIWNGIAGMLLSVFLVMCISILGVGDTYSRYQETIKEDLAFSVRKAANYKIEVQDWQETEVAKRCTFSVRNKETKQNADFYVRVATTLGFKVDKASVSLIVKNVYNETERVYQGKAVSIAEDSILYQEMGEGFVYTFYDSDGKEMVWNLKSGKDSVQEYTIEVQGAEKATLLDIIIADAPQN